MDLPAGSSIAKRLASCDKLSRDKALRALSRWFAANSAGCSDDELRWIWKGLFYCVWHADKQAVQLQLINHLASLLLSLDLPFSVRYFEVFLSTMRREWSGIDYLRLDKFYLLVRRFLHHFFLVLKTNSWDLEVSKRWMGVLEEKTLFAVDKFLAQGVNYHISEIFLKELEEFLPVKLEVVEVLLNPFLRVIQKSTDKVLSSKIKSSMFDCLLQNGKNQLNRKKAGTSADSGDEVEKFGMIALSMEFSKRFLDLASSSDTVQGSRKVLFGLREAFLKLEKQWKKSGLGISDLQVPHSEDEEAKEAVHLKAEVKAVNGFAPAGKPSKKKVKKAKKASKDNSLTSQINKKSNYVVTEAVEVENVSQGDSCSEELANGEDSLILDESVIANLQKQFEKVAAEAGMDLDFALIPGLLSEPVGGTKLKKRKRAKSKDKKGRKVKTDVDEEGAADGIETAYSEQKSAKKVRFSMKNNLVWQPHSPLPPESLRIPPSVTPRGSALKKGVPPGPVRETPATKKIKKKVKTRQKTSKSVSPAVKRLRKLHTQSA